MKWKYILLHALLKSIFFIPSILIFLPTRDISYDGNPTFSIILWGFAVVLIFVVAIMNDARPSLPKAFYSRKPVSVSEDFRTFGERIIKAYLPGPLMFGIILAIIALLLKSDDYLLVMLIAFNNLAGRIIEGEINIRRYNNGEEFA